MPAVKLRCRIGPRMLPPIKFFLEKDFPLMVMALDGIKVLDLSRLAPGPFCSMLLADFGADVTLVEAVPGASDKLSSMRAMQGGEAAEKAAAYNALGRGKKSIALNLKDSAARDIFYELVKGADVVLEGFRPGVVKRLGVDYETLAKINPRIICCSISGFGQTGPYSNLVGHDLNYISVGGALGVTGESAKPAIPINLVADFAGGGLTAAWGICMAVIARERTGRGQNVDVGMSDGVLALMTSAFIQYFSSGETIKRGQSLLNGLSPFYNIYECSDGRWFSIGSIEPHFYQALCKVLGTEDLADRQFDQSHWPDTIKRFQGIFKTKTADEWMTVMSQFDICATPALEMENVVTNEHNLARGMVVELDSPIGKVKQIGVGPKLSGTPGGPRTTAPTLGQHTDQVLRGIGLSDAKIAELRAAGAVR